MLGVGKAIVLGVIVAGAGACLLIPAGPDQPLLLTLVMLSLAVTGFSATLYNVNAISVRQAITPDVIRDRVSASLRCVMWGAMPIGALLGGLLGDAIGLRPTLAIAAVGMMLASLWVIFSPVARRQTTPASIAD